MSRKACRGPALRVRTLTVPERRLLGLLIEQFETIGACRPERLRAAWDLGAFDATLAGLYDADRLEDYSGCAMIVRNAAGVRLHPRLLTDPPRKCVTDETVAAKVAQEAEAVAYLVGRSTVSVAEMAEAFGVDHNAAGRLVVMLVDRGLLLDNPERRVYQVRRVA